MKNWIWLILCATLLSGASGCTIHHGAGGSPTSQVACFSRAESVRILASLKKCAVEKRRCKEDREADIARERAYCQSAAQSHAISLLQCREERDRALRRTCPEQRCPSVIVPAIVGTIAGIVVGVGIGVAVGLVIGR